MTVAQNALEEALAHRGAALIQSTPSDDQIIMGHVKAAHVLLQVVTRAQRAMSETTEAA